MLARDYLIILVLFSLFAGIGGLIATSISSNNEGYDNPNVSDGSFDAAYNKIDYTKGLVGDMGNATTSKEGLGFSGTVDLVFSSTVAVFQLLFGSLGMVNNIFASFVSSFGIPAAIANIVFPALLIILTIILVFVAISSQTKTKV